MTDLAALVVRMQADNSQMIKAVEQASAKVEKFSHDTEGALGSIKEQFAEIGSKLAAAFTIDKIVEFAESAIESAASLEKLSQASGISVESLSSLRLAAAAGGLSQDDLGKSLKKLNVNLAEAAGNANSKAGIAFKSMGIDIHDASGKVKDAGEVMRDLAEKFASYADGPNKTAIAVQLLGREGQNMIPVLNRGAEGMKEFADQAKEAGLVISGETAAAAEEFESKVNVLKATLVDGLGAQIAAKLLPVLSALVDMMAKSGNAGTFLSGVATVLAETVKVISVVVIEAVNEFEKMGNSLGALAAIAVAVAHGEFAQAADIWHASSEDNIATEKRTQQQLLDVLQAGGADELAEISLVASEKRRIKEQAPNVTAAEETRKAIDELQKYSDALKGEATMFGLGKAALIDYKLEHGSLADALEKAGEEGKKLAATIRENAALLQQKTDAKLITTATDKLQEQIIKYGQSALAAEKYRNTTGELGEALDRMADHGEAARAKMDALAKQEVWQKDRDALAAIDRDTLKLTGDLHAAAEAAFDFQNKMLVKDLKDTGDTAGLAKVAALKDQTLAQADFNQLMEKAAVIQERLRTVENETSLAVQKGQITQAEGEAKLEQARTVALSQFNSIHDAEMKIAESPLGNPKEIADANNLANAITNVKKQTDALTDSVRMNLESSFADNFTKLITGAETFRKAVMNMLMSVEKMFLDAIAKNYAQQLFGVGGPAGGAAGGLSSILGMLGGGGSAAAPAAASASSGVSAAGAGLQDLPMFALGGTIPLGSFGIVGEAGPELAYSGSQNMHIAPLSSAASKPVSVTNHFIISAPGGTISRESQSQTAAAAARALGNASRRAQ